MANSSGFWESEGGIDGSGNATYNLQSKRSPNRYHLTRLLRNRAMKPYSEVLTTLLADSTPASTASVTIAQIDAVADTTANVQGGVRGVTSNEFVDASLIPSVNTAGANTARAVAAADVTEIQKDLYGGTLSNRAPATYPTDASGNGGGGKVSL